MALTKDEALAIEVDNVRIAKNLGKAVLESEVRELLSGRETLKKNKRLNTKSTSDNKIIKGLIITVIILIGFTVIYFFLSKPLNTNVKFADVYIKPIDPSERGSATDDISNAIRLFRNGDTSQSKFILKNINSVESRYWLSELYLQEEKGDSVLMYLPEATSMINKRDRLNYLRILSYFLNGQQDKLQNAIDSLPQDTDEFYMKIYEKF